ncbi:hypothetical protein [Nocardia stercoris]|uniref:hypothetical protein n=1 Tax=Nocardia stercoris TaxID=2483361 RepID=UPI0011C35F38|nr:hypothetical protein [Nocardia stercoris]
MAGTDPDRAEAIARTITEPNWQARALIEIAQLVGCDSERAETLHCEALESETLLNSAGSSSGLVNRKRSK